jgi:D-alanyl-D-alanine dipeptidase
MSKIIFSSLVLSLFLSISGSAAEPGNLFKGSKQIVLVTTPGWDSVPGKLQRFSRDDAHSPWQPVGVEIPIVVGRNGLGWGRGLHPTNQLAGPIKKEGDGKSPAGIFHLSSAFGLEPLEKVAFVHLPYQQLLSPIECVDDVKSTNYNKIVDRDHVSKVDWDSSEKMREIGEQYRLGVVVDHNFNPRNSGGGSCIFMHIWKDEKTGTSGCTAMRPETMKEVLQWLDPEKGPLLVQLPEAEFAKLKGEWHLPSTGK